MPSFTKGSFASLFVLNPKSRWFDTSPLGALASVRSVKWGRLGRAWS